MLGWEAVLKTLEHIEEHLHEEIAAVELAGVAALATFHYRRLFAKLVNMSPESYIEMRRAARRPPPDFVLGSHAAIAQGFLARYSFAHGELMESPALLDIFSRPDLMLDFMTNDENVPLAVNGMALTVCRRTLFAPMSFLRLEMRGAAKAPARGRGAVATFAGNAPAGSFALIAAKDARGVPPDAIWQMPAGEYAVCSFETEIGNEIKSEIKAEIGNEIENEPAMRAAAAFACEWIERRGLSRGSFRAKLRRSGSEDAAQNEEWYPVAEKARGGFCEKERGKRRLKT